MTGGVLVVQEPIAQLVVAGDTPITVTVTEERVALLSVAEQGPSGPEGAAGAALSYLHQQGVAADLWTVNHNLGVRPLVAVLSPGFQEVEAEVLHVSLNQLLVSFAAPLAGFVRCI